MTTREKLLYLTWNHHHHHRLSQRARERKKKKEKKTLNLNDQVIIIVMSIKEERGKKDRQLTLHRVYTTNDCFGRRRPSVRSSPLIFFLSPSPMCITLLLTHQRQRACNSTHVD